MIEISEGKVECPCGYMVPFDESHKVWGEQEYACPVCERGWLIKGDVVMSEEDVLSLDYNPKLKSKIKKVNTVDEDEEFIGLAICKTKKDVEQMKVISFHAKQEDIRFHTPILNTKGYYVPKGITHTYQVTLIIKENKVIGYYWIEKDKEIAELKQIFVEKPFRMKKIASTILYELAKEFDKIKLELPNKEMSRVIFSLPNKYVEKFYYDHISLF